MRFFLTTTALALTLAACGGGSEEPTAPTPSETSAPPVTEQTPSEPEAPADDMPAEDVAEPVVEDIVEDLEIVEADFSEAIAALPAPYNEGDYERGESLFRQCATCHLLDEGAGNRVGPNLHGVFQREVGTLEGFNYSEVVAEADFEWTPEQLDHWLENPRAFLPGNRMSYAGMRRPDDRRDVITFLMIKTEE